MVVNSVTAEAEGIKNNKSKLSRNDEEVTVHRLVMLHQLFIARLKII